MKKISLIFFLFLMCFNLPVFGQYTVKIRLGQITIIIPRPDLHEWHATIYADVFDSNDNLIPPPSGATYNWVRSFCDASGFTPWASSYVATIDGFYNVPSDCDPNVSFQTYYAKLTVTINGVQYYSDTVRLPDFGTGTLSQKEVDLTQRREDNNTIGMIGKLTDNSILNYSVPFTFYYPATIDNDTYRASQDLVSNPNEKYGHWSDDYSNVVNHRSFSLTSGQMNLFSQFYYASDATVKTNTPELPDFELTIYDPWLIDDFSDALGPKNRGMNSLPYSLPNTQNNLALSTNRQGVLLNQNPNFLPNIPNYSINIPSSITLPGNGGTHNIYLQSWTTSNVTLQYSNSLTTGVVFTGDNASVTANVKATQLSDNSSAFTNNSQRKFIRTIDGTLHLVYESLGKVWYERSTNNGTTWTLANGGNPVSSLEAKNPSIDFYSNNIVGIVYQEKNGDSYKIRMAYFYTDGTMFNSYDVQPQPGDVFTDTYSTDANPVIAWENGGKFMVVWKQAGDYSGLNYRFGAVNYFYWGVEWISNPVLLNGTDANSNNPAMAVQKNTSPIVYQLAWQEDVSGSQSYINYSKLVVNNDNTITQTTPWNISYGDGMYLNYRPSIIAATDTTTRVCWAGDLYGNGSVVQAVFHDPNYYRYWAFGNNIKSPTVTLADDNSRYVIAWNETADNSNHFSDSRTLSTIFNLALTGNAVQISNGYGPSNMYGTVFSSSTTPYFFNTSNSIGSIAPKVNALAINGGRGCVLAKDKAQFYFILGNITVDNNPVAFIDVPRSSKLNSIDTLNNYLITEPFTLTDNSNFSYSVLSSVTDSAAALSALGKDGFVSFKVELLNDAGRNVIVTFDNLQLDNKAVNKVNTQLYQVNTNGIGKKTVRLVLKAESNINPQTYMIDSYASGSVTGKASSKQISYQGSLEIKDYALTQNYPNPFNPSSIISYLIPQAGFVTLKVYDILGREVKTLVNEYQAQGKYSVNFNAGNLASGVYFYQENDPN